MTAAAPLNFADDAPEPASERAIFAAPWQPDDPWSMRLRGAPRGNGRPIEEIVAACETACAGIGAGGERGTVTYPGRPRHEEAPRPDWGSYAGGRPDDDPAWRRE